MLDKKYLWIICIISFLQTLVHSKVFLAEVEMDEAENTKSTDETINVSKEDINVDKTTEANIEELENLVNTQVGADYFDISYDDDDYGEYE